MIADLKPYRDGDLVGAATRLRGLFAETVDGKPALVQYVPDSDRRDTKVGCEVSFTRHFYKPRPPRTLDAISADILAIEREAEGLHDGLLKAKKGAA
mgnify:CR=1 FL=1